MRKINTAVALACALVVGSAAGTTHAASQLAIRPTSGAAIWSGSFQNFGFAFDLGEARKRTGLAMLDLYGDGFSSSYPVGIWNEAGDLLAQVRIDNGDQRTWPGSWWVYEDISPILLNPGRYTLGAHYGAWNGADGLIQQATYWIPDPAVSFVESRVTLGAIEGFAMPTTVVPLDGASYLGPNALLAPVPEPAAWALMIVGFGAVGFALRRRESLKLA